MVRKYRFQIVLTLQVLIGSFLVLSLSQCTKPPQISMAIAEFRNIKVIANTNGIIEPIDSIEIYAPIDGFVKTIHCSEGSEVLQGQTLMLLDAPQTRVSLAEAQAALHQAKRQARVVVSGPPKEELDALDASITESALQLQQITGDLSTEEDLYNKGAVSKEAVERLKKQQELLQIRDKALKLKKENLRTRYSAEEKKWEQDNVAILTDQVKLLERQVRKESITASGSGLVYSLSVKPGSFVNRGQLLARIYQPGRIRLRAYVDEPDLGRIHKGQLITIEWDGISDRQWTGAIETPAERVVALNNRSVGHVLCSIDGRPKELIPDITVKVEITTDLKENALVVPRSSVFSHEGKYAVLLPEGKGTVIQPVEIGLATNNEFEILDGIEAGDTIVVNPREVLIVE